MKVVVIDYGMSNLGSITNALTECGAENVIVATNPSELEMATHVILPGVGAFKDGMDNLRKAGWEAPILKIVGEHVPFLGICLGMQLLASEGVEGGQTKGLDLIAGTVEKLPAISKKERIPHVGWNEVYPQIDSPLFEGIPQGTDFYFVHSFHFVPKNKKNILATTPYCGEFTSAVISDNVFGTQFHPEKSQRPGFQLLKNFLKL